MLRESAEIDQRLTAFRDLINCQRTVYSWIYSKSGELLETDCPNLILHQLFRQFGCLKYAVDESKVNSQPIFLSGWYGLMWGGVPETGGERRHIHVIGPCLSDMLMSGTLEKKPIHLVDGIRSQTEFECLLQKLPVVPTTLFQEYLLMLNYCIYDEKRYLSDICYQYAEPLEPGDAPPKRNRDQVYMMEKALLYYVREGDLNYKESLSQAGTLSTGIGVSTHNPVDRAILSVSGFATLCTRAAIEGGLSPDTAYSVGDSYIQRLTTCKSISEAGAISLMMYEDFIHRVHNARRNASYSSTIRDMVEYIEQHPEEDLSLQNLADHFGYTDYYLSRKFKKEVHESVNSYVNYVRIERAKLLLETTSRKVTDIAAALHFGSPTYFSDTFRAIVGCSPLHYRSEKQKPHHQPT